MGGARRRSTSGRSSRGHAMRGRIVADCLPQNKRTRVGPACSRQWRIAGLAADTGPDVASGRDSDSAAVTARPTSSIENGFMTIGTER